jgi:hypothetical protein
MALPSNSSNIIIFLTGVGKEDFVLVRDPSGVYLDEWNSVETQPTDQEIIDAGNDLTTVNGQVFSEWYAENGGDATLTLRKRASDLLDNVRDNEALIRALAFVVLDEINLIRENAAINLPPRTFSQLRTAIKNKIDSGDVDS